MFRGKELPEFAKVCRTISAKRWRRSKNIPIFRSLSDLGFLPASRFARLLRFAMRRLSEARSLIASKRILATVKKFSRRSASGPRIWPQVFTSRKAGDRFSRLDRKSTRLNSSQVAISYAVYCLTKKKLIYVAHYYT